jgi:amino acid adenylation domain-containing protein
MKEFKKLDKKNIQDIFALTPTQEGMLFHYLKEPGSEAYHEQLSLDITGNIDIRCFEAAWNFVIETNEMLKAVFRWEKVENPIQIILKEHRHQPRYFDLSEKDNCQKKNSLEKIKTKDRKKKFDLREIPFRVTLCKIGSAKYQMIVSNHHILYDGWSNGIILKEFFNAYNDLVHKRNPIKPVKNKFKEYVKWLKNQEKNKQEKFWGEYLKGVENRTELAVKIKKAKDRLDEKESSAGIQRTGKYQATLSQDIKNKLEEFVKKHKITLAALFYTSWGILLQKYNNTNDVLFGTTVSGRSAKLEGIEDMVGLFINTLPLRVKQNPHQTVMDVLNQVNHTLEVRKEYDSTPLVHISEYSQSGHAEELFDSLVVIDNYPLDSRLLEKASELSVDSYSMAEVTNYDLTVGIAAFENIDINFVYNKQCIEPGVIEKLSGHFCRIMEKVIKNPAKQVHEIDILSGEEKKQLLVDFNDTTADYPRHNTVHQLLAEQVERTPDYIALYGCMDAGMQGRGHITYHELNKKANQLAFLLKEKGVKTNNIVGILLERSLDMIIGILGILKAGGAYLPIEPDYPEERIVYMLKDSGAEILLKDKDFTPEAFNNCPKGASPLGIWNLEFGISPRGGQLAYIIYTSGSAGTPKGVMVEQPSVVNVLLALQKEYPFGKSDAYLFKTSVVFDVSVTELFGWFFGAGRLVILEKDGEKDPGKITDIIEQTSISHINFVPSMFNAFLETLDRHNINRLSGLKYIFLAGEALLPGVINKFRQLGTGIQLENIYGPTEGTVYSSKYPLSHWHGRGSIPIGKPIRNIKLYILDKDNHLQPIGVPGELCIAGVGVARGYLNQPQLTAEKFILAHSSLLLALRRTERTKNALTGRKQPAAFQEIPGVKSQELRPNHNTLRTKSQEPKAKLYQTGDLARWLPDGNIEFIGRIDHQVKIRGFRIETAEIENHLRSLNGICEAVVVAKEDKQTDKYLCAYIVTDKAMEPSQLKTHLARQLPGYMIPSFFVELDRLPLTHSGKVDRRSLPEPGFKTGKEYIAPRNEIETKLTQIWADILGGQSAASMSIDDKFFEVGGNSLSIIRLSSRLHQVFGSEVPIVTLFRHTTIREQARFLSAYSGDKKEISPVSRSVQPQQSDMATVSPTSAAAMDIVVIGMSGRFPGARDIHEFRDNLEKGIECITFFTDRELERSGIVPEILNNPNYIKARGVFQDADCFDAGFFDYSPGHAALMDPQVRLFHECCWEALEDACYVPDTYQGSIGLYAGASPNITWMMSNINGEMSPSEQYELLNLNGPSFTTLVSYKLNLKGPALSIQTTCSTSLVAVDTACQSLQRGTCDMALAGGVFLFFPNTSGYLYQEGMVLSPDGHCRTFDAKAAGTMTGNGAGIIVLKPMEQAMADGDHIYGVIKGSATNNDGQRKVGYTAPSVEGQAEVIRAALDTAGIDPETIGYIEAHGTGTPLGDPVEIEGLKLAFNTTKRNYCGIGSVKSNIGHLDAAAGIAGLIKALLVLKHKRIPPTINCETPNPVIDIANSPFYINTRLREWTQGSHPRRVGVSSFGIGGTNAHVVLEEFPGWTRELVPMPDAQLSPNYQLILLSAKTRSALENMRENLAIHLKQNPDISLEDAAYTLKIGRKAFQHRGMLVCSTIDEAVEILSSPSESPAKFQYWPAKEEDNPVIFMFPGQGSQYVNMGLELYQTKPGFREEIDHCFKIIKPLTGYDIKEILYPGDSVSEVSRVSGSNSDDFAELPGTADSPLERGTPDPRKGGGVLNINQTEIAQPLLFVFEYALAKLLMKWGIKPYAMIGHSIGEFVAACLAGVFSLEDALYLVTSRGKLMQSMPAGSMLSVSIPGDQLEPLLNEELSTAAVNSMSNYVISGPIDAVNGLESQLKEKGYNSRRLHTSHAFHSKMMDPIITAFQEKVGQIKLSKPQIPYISNVTGNWTAAEEAMNPEYWAKHLRCTVRFAQGLEKLSQGKNPIFVECGPGKALSTFVKHSADKDKESGPFIVNLVRHPQDNVTDNYYLLNKLGRLWLYGLNLDWEKFYLGERRYRISLPTYCFDKQRYWIEGDPYQANKEMLSRDIRLKNQEEITDWFYIPSWQRADLEIKPVDTISLGANCLLFIDDTGFGTQMMKPLQEKCRNLVTARASKAFKKESQRSYLLNPGESSDYDALFKELRELNMIPGSIVHLWTITVNHREESRLEGTENLQELGFYSLQNIVQALGRLSHTDNIRIEVVTNNMQDVTGEEELCPGKATVLGPVKVIPREYPNISCRSIDIVLPKSTNRENEKLIHQLMTEFTVENQDRVIAYRNGGRWLQTYEQMTPGKSQPFISRLKEKGVYLLTGGLGGMGMVLAEHLAKTAQAKLILTGRSPFPAKEDWDKWLHTHQEKDSVSIKIRKLKELEKHGAEVLVAAADAADNAQMQKAITMAEERFGPINGILHMAGEADYDGMIQRRPRRATENIMASKVKGTMVLDSILGETDLDFFILFSSISSIAGPFGQVGYTAANIFLDAYAHYKTSKNCTYTASINWDAWQGVGMAVDAVKQSRNLTHPLFQRVITDKRDKKQTVYLSHFSVNKHWFLDEHRVIKGKPTLPGTAYLEMARAAFEIHGGPGDIEIKDLYFISPLVLEDEQEKEVRTILVKREEEGAFDFKIISLENPLEEKWQEHARGKISNIKEKSLVEHEIKTIQVKCNKRQITISEEEFNSQEVFGPRWNNRKWVKIGKNQALAFLELPEVFAPDLKSMQLHPALMDTATAFFLEEIQNKENYLPFSYKRVTIKGNLPRKIYSYSRYVENNSNSDESIAFDISIMDMWGKELIEIKSYMFRKIGVGKRITGKENLALGISTPGLLNTLSFRAAPRQSPGTGEVEIEVLAVGLNFKDVLFALGAITVQKDEGLNFGYECVGRIVAIGAGVKDFKIGDQVIAFVYPCFRSFIRVPAIHVSLKPKHLSVEEAAAIPVAFMTAYYALIELGKLQCGERVLIHAAAGGVGMAAVKIARLIGAEIFATAGNKKKRDFLKSMGIKHIMNSRSLDFADEVIKRTGGRGVDVVLNSLSGEFIPKSFSVLGQYGRFLEIGIKDIYNNNKLDMLPFKKGLSYFAITLARDIPNFNATWDRIVQHFKNRELTPLSVQVFPVTRVSEAFQFMAQAKHIGKIVLSLQDKVHLEIKPASKVSVKPEPIKKESPGELPGEGILPVEGVKAFQHILRGTFTQVIVSPRDLGMITRQQETHLGKKPGMEEPAETNLGALYQRPRLSTEYKAPRDKLEQKLADIWRKYFGIKQVGINDDFFELGGDSLKGMTFVNQYEKLLGETVHTNVIFQSPTISELAVYFREHYPGAAAKISGVITWSLAQSFGYKPDEKNGYSAIEPVEEEEYYSLSPAQKRLYILQQLEPASIGYNLPGVIHLEETPGKERLETIFKNLIARHESLRTSFEMVSGEPVQRIHQTVDFSIGIYDAIEAKDIAADFTRPFDLSKAPLLRVNLVNMGAGRQSLFIDMHHIITDATSLSLLEQEFMTCSQQPGQELAPLRFRYKDFSEWENSDKRKQARKGPEAYWLKELAGELPVLNLPYDYPRPLKQSFAGNMVSFWWDARETKIVKDMANDNDMSLYMCVLAVFNLLFSKLSGQEDIIIGTPITVRRHTELQQIIGMLVNTLAMRNYPGGAKTLEEFLKEVKHRTLDAYENQEYPFGELVDLLAVQRDTSRNPVFDIMVNVLNQSAYSGETPGNPDQTSYEHKKYSAKFDMVFNGFDFGECIYFTIEYSTALFTPSTIEKFINYLKNIVRHLPANMDQVLSRIDFIPEAEKEFILNLSRGVREKFPREQTIHEWFEEQAAGTPHQVALVGKEEGGKGRRVEGKKERAKSQELIAITYKALNERANQLARLLRRKGVGRDTVVGLMVPRSIEMIIALLAIMKAGGAYLPIDPVYPVERKVYMLEDSGATFLLTTEGIFAGASKHFLKAPDSNQPGVVPLVTPPRKQIKDVDSLPIPDRSLVDYKKYHKYIASAMAKHTVSILSSRGCPFQCIYCNKIYTRYTARSADNIFTEINNCYNAGIRRFAFIDDVFNLNEENATRLLNKLIKNKMDVQLFFSNGLRGDILTKEFIDLMVEAGTVTICLALESASPRIQKLIKKNLNLEKFRDSVHYITRKYPHIILEMELMHGFPTETEEEAMETLDFLMDIKWVHFPDLHILKIYPHTGMYQLALEHGISEKQIHQSVNLAYHEIPDTLPFSKNFTRTYQARFLNEYFFKKERWLQVLPYQVKVLSEDELVQKYNSYLPMEIKSFPDILECTGLSGKDLGEVKLLRDDHMAAPDFSREISRYFPGKEPAADAFRVLLLDLSLSFTGESNDMLYDVVEAPFGLICLMTYLNEALDERVCGKILKSRIDFDSYEEMRELVIDFKPDLIGIRTLSLYKDFFHRSVSLIRQWAVDVPVAAGGPYATTEFTVMLQDPNIDLAVLGEGESTLTQLIEKMMANGKKLPPEERLRQINGIAFIKSKDKPLLKQINPGVILLDKINPQLVGQPVDNLNRTRTSSDLIYVIYTSGATGKPKGVMLEHKNLVNLIRFQYKYTNIDCSRILQFATISFDASFHEIFSALLSGGGLYLVSRETRADIPGLFNFIEKSDIKTLFLPMSFLRMVFNEEEFTAIFPRSVTHIQTAGEQVVINDRFKRYLQENNLFLHNHYGPSEAHVVTTLTMDPAEEIPGFPPIGKPVLNTDIYILDKGMRLVPVGVTGELLIGGIQVGRGYLNRPELTCEKFKTAHELHEKNNKKLLRGVQGGGFLEKSPPGRRKLYRTGDLGRWLEDGNIEFLGRMDHQVKIRGFRVETGEIEARLVKHPQIKEVVVTVLEDILAKGTASIGEKYLCAYFVAKLSPGDMLTVSNLREYLSQRLPDYMIPSYFVQLDALPLTPNGKIDRKSLPEPRYGEPGKQHVAPRDKVESKLVRIWVEVIFKKDQGEDLIDIDSSFFESGGHSLTATILVSKIHKEFNIKMSLQQIFKTPTIRGQAEYIRNAGENKYLPIEPAKKMPYYALSSAQERLYILHQMEKKGTVYNLPQIVELQGNPEKERLEETFGKIIQRHEILRTSFEMIEGKVKQKIHEKVEFEIEYYDLGTGEIAAPKSIIKNFIRPFDLSKIPLIRAGLIRTGEKKHILMLDMHHIISDAASQKILIKDFVALYSGLQLPPLSLQYKDYSSWQHVEKEKDAMKSQQEYWLKLFPGESPILNLPIDFSRPTIQNFAGSSFTFEIGNEDTTVLKKMALKKNVTLYILLLAIYNVLLKKICQQEDIVVGTPVSGRRHSDLDQIIGVFINTLVIRNYPKEEIIFSQFMERVKENTLNAFENQDYPFEDLVRKLDLERPSNRNPLFDVMFAYQTLETEQIEINAQDNDTAGLKLKHYNYESQTSKFDLILNVLEAGDYLSFTLQYKTTLFKEETIKRLIDYFKEIVSIVISDNDIPIKDISIDYKLVEAKKIHKYTDFDF